MPGVDAPSSGLHNPSETDPSIALRLLESEQRRVSRLETIHRVGRLIGNSLSLEDVLQSALDVIGAVLPDSNVGVLLVAPEEPKMLVLRARTGIYRANVIGEYRQPIYQGIVGAAAREFRPVLVPDVWSDPRYVAIPGARTIHSELALPIRSGDRLLGVLNIESEHPILDEDAEGLEVVADQLATAIENAARFEQERRRTEKLSLLARVGQRIAARLDPDELFAATVEELHRHLGYDHVSLFVLDSKEPGWLVQRAYASFWSHGEASPYRQSVDQGILGAVARSRQPVLINDVAADPRYIPVTDEIELRAELAVPILAGERLMGILDVASRARFGEEDLTALQIIAGQLAVAIENARLFSETHRTLDETRLLYQTSQRIGAARDVDEVIGAYLEQVAVQGRYTCNVARYEFDENGERTAVIVGGRWSPREGFTYVEERLPYTRDALDLVLDAGLTVTIQDVHSDPRVSPTLREIQAEAGRPALALIPLIARGQRIGIVVLSSPEVHLWQDADLRLYQATAVQLATAIDSRQQQRLALERRQRIAILEERQRLARELHDSVTQLLFSITLHAQSIDPAYRRDPVEGQRRISRLLVLSQQALAEMRTLLVELRPQVPGPGAAVFPAPLPGLRRALQNGLPRALREYASGLAWDGLQVEVDTAEYPARNRGGEREEALYRIAQEALHNIVKHARARQVTVRLAESDGISQLTIQDDGIGFDPGFASEAPPDRPGRRGGLGLAIMRERAEALGGSLRIAVVPNRGTSIEVTIPVLPEHGPHEEAAEGKVLA